LFFGIVIISENSEIQSKKPINSMMNQICVKSHLDQIPLIWSQLETKLMAYYGGRLESFFFEVKQALFEALANSIEHAHKNDGRNLTIQYHLEDHFLEFHLIDTGEGFDLTQADPSLPDLESESSRGLFILNSLMDEVSYVKGHKKNIFKLKKKINEQSTNEKLDLFENKKRRAVIFSLNQERTFKIREKLRELKISTAEVKNEIEYKNIVNKIKDIDFLVIEDKQNFQEIDFTKFETPVVSVGFESSKSDFNFKWPLCIDSIKANLKTIFKMKDLNQLLNEKSQALQSHIREARKLLVSILPPAHKKISEVTFSHIFYPCDLIGGDMISYFPLDENKIGFYLADVSGHGITSAMFALWINRAMMPENKSGGVTKSHIEEKPYYEVHSPAKVCEKLDQLMSQNDDDQYLTMIYGIIEPALNKLTYCCAGHPSPYLISQGVLSPLESITGPPIGMGLGMGFEDQSLTLEPGDRVFLYSDGAVEAANQESELFGEERLKEALDESLKKDVFLQLKYVSDQLKKFTKKNQFEDDLSLLNIEYQGEKI